jgi:gas vesicle protein
MIKTAFKGVGVASKGLKLASLFTASPVLLVAVAIGAVIGAIIAIVKNWDKVKEKMAQVAQYAKEKFNALKQWFWDWGYKLLGPFGYILKAVNTHWDEIKDAGQAAFDAVAGAVQWVIDKVTSLINTIKDAIGWLKQLPAAIPNIAGNAAVATVGGDTGGSVAVPGVVADDYTAPDESIKPKYDMRWLEKHLDWFADGGIVPGPVGSPQIIGAHGGEVVLNQSQQRGLGGTMNHTGTITVKGVNSANELIGIAEILADTISQNDRRLPNRVSLIPI